MANVRRHRGGRGSRKHGRNEAKCQFYRSVHRREKNRIRRIEKHLRHHLNDNNSKKALRRFEELLRS